MSLIVQKYGGSSLKTPEEMKRVAARIAALKQKGHQIIVVVSAMGQTTDELLRLAYQVSHQPNRRELDMLLTTGERVSMALMSMALQDLGCASLSFTGSQSGVFTDSSHSNARIIDIKPTRVIDSLTQGKVIVIAGFQGVDPKTKEITTLGRGGSDTTAVAMAAHFEAERCEILKDVDGIFSADPKRVNEAIHYHEFPISTLEESCYWGAKVLHYRSVELARALQVPLYVGSSIHQDRGTRIYFETKEKSFRPSPFGSSNMYEEVKALTVNSLLEVHHLSVSCFHPDEGLSLLAEILNKYQLSWPQILASVYENHTWRVMISSTEEQIGALKQALLETPFSWINSPLCAVTVSCRGSYSSSFTKKVMSCLKNANILPHKSLQTGNSISVFVNPDQKDLTLRTLHQLIS